MKKTIFSLTFCLLFFGTINAQNKTEHSVKVIGTAEMEIVPDEIYMSVTLKEYTKDKKKFTIEELEKSLVNYLEKITLADKKDIKMNNMDAYIISVKRKNKDEIITKSYEVKFKNSQQVYQLYSVMDSLGINRAYVNKYSHSKMDEYKKQIKINAIVAAKEKAGYLMNAIGEKAGKAISVDEKSGLVTLIDGRESERNRNYYSNNSYSQSHMNVRFLGGEDDLISSEDSSSIGNKTIKITYEIEAEFEIQ
jgi:uncharacterized protein